MYTCLAKNSSEDLSGYRLVAIRQEDIESIRIWRNAQIEVLRQNTPISTGQQQAYFHEQIFPTFTHRQPKQILFSYLLENELIGYGGLTHIDWEVQRAEISFLANPRRVKDPSLYQSDFSHFLKLISKVAFEDLHLHRLFTETFAFRKAHMKILEQAGFQKEGILREHVYKNGQWFDSVMHGLLEISYEK
jgi:RimJ/RimL family protein N-acetyltransferase